MLQRVELINFKAFEKFTLTLRGNALLVGPNNAGKSTLIAALRAGANMLRIAKRARAVDSEEVDGSVRWGHGFAGGHVDLIHENLRHEFHQVETRMRLLFSGGAELIATWPPGDDTGGFFYVRHKDVTLRKPRDVRAAFPSVGLVPVLGPLDHQEEPWSAKHVRANLDSRLASHHFRNQLYLLEQEPVDDGTRFDEFRRFAEPWLNELTLGRLELSLGGQTAGLDLFYEEPGSTIQKEVFWVGDGMQIWLQLLLHVFRLQDTDVIVLDEPDVFLHSDLQRRLVGLLESVSAQVITATHSPEVLAEAEPDSIMWISRNRRRAVAAPTDRVLFEMSDSLGTQFNLPLARALRARSVLFVEGKDGKVIRRLANTVGAHQLAREDGLVIVVLDGVERAEHVEAFVWLTDKVLEKTVRAYVVLDRDYRSDATITAMEAKFKDAGIDLHVWCRHELENYLLNPAVLARVSGAPEGWVVDVVREIVASLEDEVYSGVTAEFDRQLRRRGTDTKSIAKAGKQAADALWKDPDKRVEHAPGKEILSRLNERLQANGHKAVTPRRIAAQIAEEEIPAELRGILHQVDEANRRSATSPRKESSFIPPSP